MMDDVDYDSDASADSFANDAETTSRVPDKTTYRFSKVVKVYDGDSAVSSEKKAERALNLKVHHCSDRVCVRGLFGDTSLDVTIMSPVHSVDAEDFEAGILVKLSGCSYISEYLLKQAVEYIIPPAAMDHTFIEICIDVYADAGCVLPTALMATAVALTVSRVDVKGVVVASTVFVNSEGQTVVDPDYAQEQQARNKKDDSAYITGMKIKVDDHIRWYDMEGLTRVTNVIKALQEASLAATTAYGHVSGIFRKVIEHINAKAYELS